MMDGIKVIASVCLNQLWNNAAQRHDELQEEPSQWSFLSVCVCVFLCLHPLIFLKSKS